MLNNEYYKSWYPAASPSPLSLDAKLRQEGVIDHLIHLLQESTNMFFQRCLTISIKVNWEKLQREKLIILVMKYSFSKSKLPFKATDLVEDQLFFDVQCNLHINGVISLEMSLLLPLRC